jgi:hypothetical protein
MDAAAEQLVLDYLRRLEDAARGRLGAAERMAFMARSRVAVARQISETRATEPAEVQRLLRRFGDPGGLAARERQRLDRETPAGPGGAVTALRPEGAGAASGLDGAAMARDLNGAGPASGGVQRHVAPAPQAARLPGRLAAAAAGRPSATAPALHRPMTARWRPGRDVPARLAPGAAPDRTAGPGPGTGGDGEPGAERGTGGAGWLGGVLAVVRKHPLECLAVVLIGLGGLIDPWPLWLIGALAVLASPLWDMRDKLAAVAIPLAAALVGAVAAAGFAARPPGLSGYAHEVRVDGWNLLRAGAVLGAIYLARRIRRGRRPRREPPWRRPPADAR